MDRRGGESNISPPTIIDPVISNPMDNLWKWFAEQWAILITHHFEGLMIVGTSLLGSMIGLRREESVSFWLGITVVVTSATTSILLAKLAEFYLELPNIAVYTMCYFLGTVGNRITLAFIKAVSLFIADPLGTLKYISRVVAEFLKIKNNAN